MRVNLYIDGEKEALFSVYSDTLSDGSQVWNIYIRGGTVLGFDSESKADEAFTEMTRAVKLSMSRILVV